MSTATGNSPSIWEPFGVVRTLIYSGAYPYFVFGKRSSFRLNGQVLGYAYRRYNHTWTNERCVELPIVWDAVRKSRPEQILEVGNVLSHYFNVQHQVVDKYERAPGIINVDAVDFTSDKQFNLIVSISTLEHMGFDETPADPSKPQRAVEHLISLLAPGGQLLFSVPLGYNPHLDQMIRAEQIPLTGRAFLRRDGPVYAWRQVSSVDRAMLPYSRILGRANAVMIGYYVRDGAQSSV